MPSKKNSPANTAAKKKAVAQKAAPARKSAPAASAEPVVKQAPVEQARPAKAGKAPARHTSHGTVKIFQIYYRDDQRKQLDEAFVALDNSGNTSHLLEFEVFRRLAGSRVVEGCDYWGALSWKFFEKTGLRGKEVHALIEANPGYDCYFCNPNPGTESTFHNLWLQGETSHPNFINLAKTFFSTVGLDEQLLLALYPSRYFASANYFVANPHFWKEYIAFVGNIIRLADERLPLPAKQAMYSSLADPKGMHADAGYWPFIIERLFSVFLILHGDAFKIHKFEIKTPSLDKNVHHRLLLQMKDAACKTKNNWLAVCWVNYRNLYLSELRGKEWVRKFIETITPGKLVFLS
ncbi:MAG: hypothetical protein WC091_13265 [Sulfuricellaceae bacterium]